MKKFESLSKTITNDISAAKAIEQIAAPMNLNYEQKLLQSYKEYSNIQCE